MMASPPLYGILHQSQLSLTIKPLLDDFFFSDIYMDDIYPINNATYTQNLIIFLTPVKLVNFYQFLYEFITNITFFIYH